jgi:acetyl esterase/lipase
MGFIALLLAAAAAGSAALIVVPAPSKTLALAAIVASEKSLFVAAAAVVAALIALGALRRGARVAPVLAILLSGAAFGIGLLPAAQARALAKVRGVALDPVRYLTAPIDGEGPGTPDKTVEYAAGRMVDVYVPPATDPPKASRPIVVIHGGFWSAGDRGQATLSSRRLAELGFTVFDIDYRLAPQPNWQAAIGDVKCAMGWVKRHAKSDDWNIDATKLTLLGRSAGGHLALMAAYTADDPRLPPSCDTDDVEARVDTVVALYAPTDLWEGWGRSPNPRVVNVRERIEAFVGRPANGDSIEKRLFELSPARRVTKDSPRTLVAHGGRDQFVSAGDMRALTEKLAGAGVAHDTLYIPYAQHAFDFVVGGFSSQLLEATLVKFLDGAR